METLKITKDEALTIYSGSTDTGKKYLEEKFGKDMFTVDLKAIIKTFKDGLLYKGVAEDDVLPEVPSYMKAHEKSIHAFAKLVFLAEIFRSGWVADFTNHDQKKYYPWFINNSGSGLSFRVYGYVDSHTRVASRLCFPNSDIAIHFGKQFINEYNDFLI